MLCCRFSGQFILAFHDGHVRMEAALAAGCNLRSVEIGTHLLQMAMQYGELRIDGFQPAYRRELAIMLGNMAMLSKVDAYQVGTV